MATKIKFKRSSLNFDALKGMTLEEGEPLYLTNDKHFYIGMGGQLSGTKHVAQITSNSSAPDSTVSFYIGNNTSNEYVKTINNVNNAKNAENLENLSIAVERDEEDRKYYLVLRWGEANSHLAKVELSDFKGVGSASSASSASSLTNQKFRQ